MKIAIMQPYFFPYIGYFQLINCVDDFVLYDNIKFTKKGWIQRNRILQNNNVLYISLSLKKDSDFLDVCERYLSISFDDECLKMLRRIQESYRKAPYFKEVYPFLEECILCKERNLFAYLYNSISMTLKYLDIHTNIIISSKVNINHDLKSHDKVIAICKELNARHYVNPIGGVELYSKEDFKANGINLSFLKSGNIVYQQFGSTFCPNLSIVDVLMFNSVEKIKLLLQEFTFV